MRLRRRIDANDAGVVRDLRALIESCFGEEAAIAFLEAIANVREHCGDKECCLSIGPCGWKLADHGLGIGTGLTRKPHAVRGLREGGFGLPMIVALGGRVISSTQGTTILWAPHHCRQATTRTLA